MVERRPQFRRLCVVESLGHRSIRELNALPVVLMLLRPKYTGTLCWLVATGLHALAKLGVAHLPFPRLVGGAPGAGNSPGM